jgi:co-chaperonin GroES (HSP10)
MLIRPIGKFILVSVKKEPEPEQGKLYIPKTNKDEKFKEAFLIAKGKDCILDAEIGDKLFLKPYNHGIHSFEDKESSYFIIGPEDVLGIYN